MAKSKSEFTGAIPTVAGAGSARLGPRVEMATAGNVAEFVRLPKAGERCPVSGASRSWLIETDQELSPEDRFLIRVRRRGCLRGTVFTSVPKLSSFLSRVAAGKVEGFIAGIAAEVENEN
ncbi:MAG: hypothetical protein NTV93_13710 [Verrucomicrobia bacterium]|nr:hypothetical protein [Verrucomicrobiota bacterium]